MELSQSTTKGKIQNAHISSSMLWSPSDMPFANVTRNLKNICSIRRHTLPNHLHQSRLPLLLERITRCCRSLIVLNQARFPQGEITSCRTSPPRTLPPPPAVFPLAHCFQMLYVITIRSANYLKSDHAS